VVEALCAGGYDLAFTPSRSRLSMIRATSCLFVATLALSACSAPAPPPGAAEPDPQAAAIAAVRRTLDETERRINANDIGFVSVFADDAVIVAPGTPDISGIEAIRKTYTDLLNQATVAVDFRPAEILVMGDYAYERGTYTMTVTQKTTGTVLQDVRNNDMHIFKRQADGTWKTWRMMVNSAG
jgi:uncharacterized protein (TIGR02246 family)